jgi:O-antigen ligase
MAWRVIDGPGLERWPVWSLAWSRITESWHSLLVGHGLSSRWLWSFQADAKRLGTLVADPTSPTGHRVFASVHNDWLQLLYEVGLVGTLPLVALAACVLVVLWRAGKTDPVSAAACAGASAWLVGSLVHFPARLVATVPVALALLALSHHAEGSAHGL